ncbi:MAG: glycosyltransferase [Bacteroidetes bacterium]|nr:glycosyltransferase [Bacteroidota bacterium]
MVTSQLVKRHQEILEITEQYDHIEIRILPDFEKPGTLIEISKEQGRILNDTLTEIKPSHCLLMDFDLFQIPLALGLRFQFPLVICGIYFRPFLELGKSVQLRDGFRRYVRYMRKRAIFSSALNNPHLSSLFSLDRYFVDAYHSSRAHILSLCDGIESQNPSMNATQMKQQIGFEDHRKVALFFGSIAKRKGIFELLEAITILSPSDQEKLCLVIVGKVASEDQNTLLYQLESLERSSRVQLIKELHFITDVEMANYMTASDLVLLPYIGHTHSSGILVRAAIAGKPVLGSNDGLIGRYIRDYKLGLDVISTDPSEIATGILMWLNSPDTFPFASSKSNEFASKHSAKQFSKTIFDQIYTESNEL